MVFQRPVLLRRSALANIVASLDSRADLDAAAERLAQQHAEFGVSEQHHAVVGEALFWSLEQELGPRWTPAAGQDFGWSVVSDDPSRIGKSYGRQSYPEILAQARIVEFTLSWESEAAMFDNAFAIARANGRVKDVLVIPNINGAYVSEQTVWGLCRVSTPVIHRTTRTYQQKFSIEERL